jgi:hypothetical protein
MIELLGTITLGFIPGFLLLDAFRGPDLRSQAGGAPACWQRRCSSPWARCGSARSGAGVRRPPDRGAALTWGRSVVRILAYELVHYSYLRIAHRFTALALAHQITTASK